MAYQLNFTVRYKYNSAEVGITIPVALKTGNLIAEVEAKLDTGAEPCIFQREIADLLGLELAAGIPLRMGSLAGTLPTFGHRVVIQAFDFSFESTVYFAAIYGLPRNLLGRRGFLEHLDFGLTLSSDTAYFNSIYPPEIVH